ncbi:unnamed protein product [Medioppia subpectinata]|uniref:Suppressor of white apricot N-terminal domain-containing protein n=1 Tax=Medioppia subpectinata TaxID=1979941 RepID=A0A7R9L632_9ACAR|nr:unnamed protein product [Medioppia subpectinata]CAG2116016.1 unnamed protein product [Medioppia subpectinata]
MDTSGMTSETALSSYSLFRSIGSEPTHLWSQPSPTTTAAGGHHKTSFGDRTHNSGHKSGANSDPDLDQLFVFGYSCKLFRDDRRAREIDSGQHLIGWNGSTDHLIDRFDVRGYLNDLSEFDANRRQCAQQLSAEELEMERLCDEERYADLNNDYVDDNHGL